MANLKVLYIAHRIPYPPNKGDKIRSFNEIKHLSRLHTIHLAALVDDPKDLQYESTLVKYCRIVETVFIRPKQNRITGILRLPTRKSLSVGYFYSHTLQAKIDRLLAQNHYDAIICFSSPMAEYMFSSPQWSKWETLQHHGFRRPRLIMDFCDLDSDKWRQYAQRSKFPLNAIFRLESKLLLAYEKKINQAFDHSLFVSQPEADLFSKAFSKAKTLTIIPNGVDHNYFAPIQLHKPNKPNEPNKPTLLFTGAMDYHANIDGVTWFCRTIFPTLKEKYPNAQFFIVGSKPHPLVKALAEIDGVHVIGFVEDIRPYYQMADVCVIPLRIARGVQNKVLEAMAMAKPVIATPAAVQGIRANSGDNWVVAETPKAFVQTIQALLDNQNRRQTLSVAARQFVKEHYDWSTSMQALENILTHETKGQNSL